MTTLWDSIKKGIIDSAKMAKEGLSIAGEKADEYSKKGRITLEISKIKRKIENQFTELGGKVYHIIKEEHKTDLGSNEEINGFITAIKALEEELSEKELQREQIGSAKEKEEGTAEVKTDADAPSEDDTH